MKIYKTVVLLTLIAFNTACSKATIELPDFRQLVQNNYIDPFKNADTDRWLQVFTDDAVGMHNTLPPFVGKDAIRQFGDIVAQNLNIEQMDIVIDDVQVNGSWALTRGSFTSKFVPKTVADSSTIEAQQGKFILLWEQQKDNSWKVILDMGNSNTAPMAIAENSER